MYEPRSLLYRLLIIGFIYVTWLLHAHKTRRGVFTVIVICRGKKTQTF